MGGNTHKVKALSNSYDFIKRALFSMNGIEMPYYTKKRRENDCFMFTNRTHGSDDYRMCISINLQSQLLGGITPFFNFGIRITEIHVLKAMKLVQ